MIWFFERDGAEMRIVTRVNQETGGYVVEIEGPNRDKVVQHYADYETFNARVQQLHLELLESRWLQQGAPAMITDGWRGPTSGGAGRES